ncbi:MAG: hypothetical protein D3916_06550 [Candidatus Electrothrix sp. MAN1_4]|nr:hypothetical protein [Candidatus Electrothrix sp. MAN1_4]
MKTLQITAVALTLLTAATASAERNKVAFLHMQDKTLKEDCVEIKGKHDALPSYSCYDDEGIAQSMTLGEDWRLVQAEKVCFYHTVRDTIRVCMEITPLTENAGSSYTCAIGDGPTKSFEPTKRWEKLTAEDKRCAPRLQSFDVPKNMVIQGLPDWGGSDATQE